MHRVVVLASDGVIPFELSIAERIFGAAVGAGDKPLYEVLTCTPDGQPVRTDADFAIAVRHDAQVVATADTVIIPAADPFIEFTERDSVPAPLIEALALTQPTARLASICIGSYLLAALGLLDERPATTHWYHASHFQQQFPRVKVNPDVLFVDDGDILTSAGAAAGVDMCLHLIRADHGSQIASQAARSCVVPPWRDGGQAQFIQRPVPQLQATGTAPTRAWALERLDQPLPLADLAGHARMSTRTFTRRFRDETGTTPRQWLISQRIDLALRLLEATTLPVDRIARQSGLGTAASLRQHLHSTLGVSPATYRRTFRL